MWEFLWDELFEAFGDYELALDLIIISAMIISSMLTLAAVFVVHRVFPAFL